MEPLVGQQLHQALAQSIYLSADMQKSKTGILKAV